MSFIQPGAGEESNFSDECKEILLTVPREKGWISLYQYHYQGFWCPSPGVVQSLVSFQRHFQARDSDIVVVSIPKSGTTWLKALTFAIVNRHRFQVKTHPLLTSVSHTLVPFFEVDLYLNDKIPDFSSSKFPDPRVFGTHVPFASLGTTIKESNCKIVYVSRNPFDRFVSLWHFVTKIRPQSLPSLSLDEAFDKYCQGQDPYGPFWNHMLGYWNESLKRPKKVVFLKYEEMKEDVVSQLKRMAEFLDCPFTVEEERNGVIEDIAKLCSFTTMKKLEINKTGRTVRNIENKDLFRKAEVGDWVNYLTPVMQKRLAKVIEEKFDGSGLTFKMNLELPNPVQQNMFQTS